MTTFDAWDAGLRPPENYLMHFRTKGSKNGVRRYQNEDGTWTEAGLEARRKREGWGESRKTRKLEKKIAKAEKRQERKAAREEKAFARSEKQRKKKLSGLTDEEMRAKLERAKMEAEYRDLTKRGSLIESGSKLIGKYLDYKSGKEQRAIESNKQKLEMERLKTQQIQAKEQTMQAKHNVKASKYNAKKAKEDRKTKEADVEGGLEIQRRAQLKQTKLNYRNTTVRGAIGNFLNAKAKGAGEAAGESSADRSRTDTALRNQRKVDKYNGGKRSGFLHLKKGRPNRGSKVDVPESTWNRQQTEARERRANAENVARSNAEREKWKAKQGKK